MDTERDTFNTPDARDLITNLSAPTSRQALLWSRCAWLRRGGSAVLTLTGLALLVRVTPVAARLSAAPGNVPAQASLQTAASKTDQTPTLGEEQVAPEEASLIQQINDLVLSIHARRNPPGTKLVPRDAHPKMHGLVRAEFLVLDDLPPNLRYGVFRKPRTFAAWIRFSASSAIPQPDTTPDGHGMAIKLMGVPGQKLLEAEKNATTQDFILINYPGFVTRNLPDYVTLQKAIAAGNPGAFFGSHPTEAKAAFDLTHQDFQNPLQVRYWSQTPYRLGTPTQAVKYSVRPITLQQNARPANPGPNYLTEAMAAQLAQGDAYFEFMVQVQKDPTVMPIEDSVVIWDEKESPFQRVALIRIPRQSFTAPAQVTFGENLSFTPWHCLPEHQPLGCMNRTRRVVYETLSRYRHQRNNAARTEPTGKETFPK